MIYSFRDKTIGDVYVLSYLGDKDFAYVWTLLCSSNLWCSGITNEAHKEMAEAVRWATRIGNDVKKHDTFLDMIGYYAEQGYDFQE